MKKCDITVLLGSILLAVTSCSNPSPATVVYPNPDEISVVVLGTIQDAGSPQVGCTKECCTNLFTTPDPDRKVVSLGLIARGTEKIWLFEATPDFTTQMKLLNMHLGSVEEKVPNGIFLTHAHIGHYTGLMYLGKEAMNAAQVPVYAMPRMKQFLENNGPWNKLVTDSNITIRAIEDGAAIQLSTNIKVTPFTVPHRDEFSETVGFRIEGPNKKLLFIPDIDKWTKWSTDIIEEIQKVDYAFLDATFYDEHELKNRDMSEVPHPFIVESMELFKDLSELDKNKVHFIHFNHTNPVIHINKTHSLSVIKEGYKIAKLNQIVAL
ncbi:MAG: MBL fold metallo-hydrolase [Flavobacteriales bacterium]|nr:MBL fold metallo-hydrolase [Flavobacteriales bacterium]